MKFGDTLGYRRIDLIDFPAPRGLNRPRSSKQNQDGFVSVVTRVLDVSMVIAQDALYGLCRTVADLIQIILGG
jgi:hypothetical protein